MKDPVPVHISEEQEFFHFVCGCPACLDSSACAANALVLAHHRSFGCSTDHVESILNEFDTLGFRVYVDHIHLELSSCLTRSARSLVLAWRVGLRVLRHILREAEESLGHKIFLSLDLTNRKGVAWGFHLNFLIARWVFEQWQAKEWDPLFAQWVPFICSSPPLFGAGKLGAENGAASCMFQLSQRSDHFSKLIGLETVSSKSLINTRDESLSNSAEYARFHSIVFDSNRMEYANWLKFGTSQLLLSLIAEGSPLPSLRLKDPLQSFAVSSRDLAFCHDVELADGRQMPALDIQYRLAEACGDALAKNSPAASQVPDAESIVTEWIATLEAISSRAPSLVRRLDWRARLEFIAQARKADSRGQASAEMVDLQYAQINGLFESLEARGAVDTLEDFLPARPGLIEVSISRDTARALLLQRFGARVEAVDWHYIRTRAADGESWEVLLDDPLNSDRILRIGETEPDANRCLERLASEGFAKKLGVGDTSVACPTTLRPKEGMNHA